MALELAVYVTWEELYSKRPTKEEILEELRHLDRLHSVILLSRINAHLFLDGNRRSSEETNALQRFLIGAFFDDNTLSHAKEKLGNAHPDFRRAFHIPQVLALLKDTVTGAAETGGIRPDVDKEARYSLGRCLIKTSDLLMTPEMSRLIEKARRSDSVKNMLAIQLQGGSAFEINNPPPLKSSVVRSDIMFSEVMPRVKSPLNVGTEFVRQTGLDLNTYLDMLFGVIAHYLSKKQQQLIEDPGLAVINPNTFFGKEVSPDHARRFWEMESASLEELKPELQEKAGLQPHQDFTVFRRRPFVRIGADTVVCLNPGFVQEKLEVGLFWSIVNHLSNDEDRKRMFDSWGQAFQEYVNHLLATSVHKDSEKHIPFPNFAGKKHRHEAFDAIVTCGKVCIVIESKGGFLSASAKYAEDNEKFLGDLDLKFGAQPGGGVEQLVRKIAQIFAAQESERREIEGLDISSVEVVVPVLVVQDLFVASPFTAPWLAKLFRDNMRKKALMKKVVWTGLVLMDIGELESIRPFMISSSISFTDFVMERARKGDPGSDSRIFTFGDTSQQLVKERAISETPHSDFDDRFDRVINRVSMRFFNRPFERLERA